MIGDGDLEQIFESGDFDTTATFTIGTTATLDVQGWFTAASQSASVFGDEVRVDLPSFVAPTSALTTVKKGMSVSIDGVTYTIEDKEATGVGTSVCWLKT